MSVNLILQYRGKRLNRLPHFFHKGKVVEKGTKCKMARGQMVRWLAENQIKAPEDLQTFDQLGYQFCRSTSVQNHTVFLWMYQRTRCSEDKG